MLAGYFYCSSFSCVCSDFNLVFLLSYHVTQSLSGTLRGLSSVTVAFSRYFHIYFLTLIRSSQLEFPDGDFDFIPRRCSSINIKDVLITRHMMNNYVTNTGCHLLFL